MHRYDGRTLYMHKQNERHIVSILLLKLAISITRIKQKTLLLSLTISPVGYRKDNVSFPTRRSDKNIISSKVDKFLIMPKKSAEIIVLDI